MTSATSKKRGVLGSVRVARPRRTSRRQRDFVRINSHHVGRCRGSLVRALPYVHVGSPWRPALQLHACLLRCLVACPTFRARIFGAGLYWRLAFFASATTSPKQVHMDVGERAKRGHSWFRLRARSPFSGVRVILFTRALA